jgi:hypothetical protein
MFITWRRASDDAVGHRHAKVDHDVDDLTGSSCFGPLFWQSPGVEAATNQGLVPHHRHLAQ